MIVSSSAFVSIGVIAKDVIVTTAASAIQNKCLSFFIDIPPLESYGMIFIFNMSFILIPG